MKVAAWCNSIMLLLFLSTIFRGEINFPDEIVVYINTLDAMPTGLVSFMDNDFVHKFMQKLWGQFGRLGILFYNPQKALDIDSLRLDCSCSVRWRASLFSMIRRTNSSSSSRA